jgi:hypothetical protein
MKRINVLTLTVVLSGLVFFSCSEDKSINDNQFCSFVNSGDINKTGTAIDAFLSDLSEHSSSEQKLQKLTQWLKSYSCITDATILCNSCIYTYPAISEIAVSFIENNKTETVILAIRMSEPLKVAGYHE